MRTIIGLAGVKTSGKSTATQAIQEVVEGAVEVALANKLKNTCAETFGIQRVALDDQRYKEVPFEVFGIKKTLTSDSVRQILSSFGIDTRAASELTSLVGMELTSPRHIAQIVGTQILRNFGADIHCENLELGSEGVYIVSDLRFPNEFEYFQRMAENDPNTTFLPLYIQRDEAEKHVTPESHASETSVFLFSDKCKKIDNNGPISALVEQVTAEVIEILKDKAV